MSKKIGYVRFRFKSFERKIKSPFVIYADFKSILVPEDNGKQNIDESYTNKYQKHVACSYGYKLVYAEDKLSEPSRSYLGEDDVYNFINITIEEGKSFTDIMKKHFNKELVMTKEDNADFRYSTKYWICDTTYVEDNVKVRDHSHMTRTYIGSAHRQCNINVKLNHKIPIVSHNLKNYGSHLIRQELDKFNHSKYIRKRHKS